MTTPAARHYVWDLPVRLFHWLLVVLIGFSWWSAENRLMEWHFRSGIIVLGLLVFRLLWGLFGTSTARFSQFVRGPQHVAAYLRGAVAAPGHNPLGGWSVVALLAVLAFQVGSGLFSVDTDGIDSGPLSYLVDFDQGRSAAGLHELSFNVLLALVALHIAAIVFHLVVKRRNLTRAMITGYQSGSAAAPPVVRVAVWKPLAAAAASLLVAWWVSGGARL